VILLFSLAIFTNVLIVVGDETNKRTMTSFKVVMCLPRLVCLFVSKITQKVTDEF